MIALTQCPICGKTDFTPEFESSQQDIIDHRVETLLLHQ